MLFQKIQTNKNPSLFYLHGKAASLSESSLKTNLLLVSEEMKLIVFLLIREFRQKSLMRVINVLHLCFTTRTINKCIDDPDRRINEDSPHCKKSGHVQKLFNDETSPTKRFF